MMPLSSSDIRFSIEQKKVSWSAATDTFTHHDQARRFADVYVFCMHKPVPATNRKVVDPDYWQFWVVTTEDFDRDLGAQKSVGINGLSKLATPVRWTGLRAAVHECLDETHTDE